MAGSVFLILGLVPFASADITGTLSFTNPTVTVGPTDAIKVFITLTLDPNSDPFVSDSSASVSLPSSQLNDHLYNPLPQVYDSQGNPTTINLATDTLYTVANVSLGCEGTFFGGCGGPGDPGPYHFTFGYGDPSYFGQYPNLNLQPGQSQSFLFGTLTPTGAGAPIGTYNLPYAEVDLETVDLSVFDSFGGSPLISFFDLADTLNTAGFTADVAAVTPEPGFYGLIGLALGGMFFARRTRKN